MNETKKKRTKKVLSRLGPDKALQIDSLSVLVAKPKIITGNSKSKATMASKIKSASSGQSDEKLYSIGVVELHPKRFINVLNYNLCL